MFVKLNGSRNFSTIDLRSGYYHIGFTKRSRPKSAFVVPIGKFKFLRTPFSHSQAPALTKEAYTIYTSVRKLTFYITGHNIKIKSDHLLLKKFLEKKTLNAKVNNWAIELEQFKIELDWISGIKNMLADSLLRLLNMTPEAEPIWENPGEEFSVACFEELETEKVHETFIEQIENVEIEVPKERKVKVPTSKEQMIQLQKMMNIADVSLEEHEQSEN